MLRINHLFAAFLFVSVLSACGEEAGLPINEASATRGEELADDCKACHSLASKSNRVGPHLVDVVGRDIASVRGYDYSEVLLAQQDAWTAKTLAVFILNPTKAMPGTKMAYGGISPDEAKDIVEFLRSLSK
jgi:cytochrome c